MPRIPDATSLGERPTPRSGRAIVSYRGDILQQAVVDAADKGIAAGTRLLERQDEKRGVLEDAYAEGALLRGQVDLMSKLEDNDYGTYEKRFTDGMREVRAKAAAMIADPAKRELFNAQAEIAETRGLAQVRDKARAKEKDFGRAGLDETLRQNRDTALSAADEPTRTRLLLASDDAIAGARDRGYLSAEEATAQRQRFLDDYGKAWVSMRPAEEQVKLLGAAPATAGGFDSAIETVMKNEGGYVAQDGASGAPAIYGINAKWHPAAYAEAKRITDSQGEAAGKSYAKEFYKGAFWDKNGIDKLPAATQAIVFDGVINHRMSFAEDLREAAARGASPQELIAMRKAEYERLASAAPAKYARSLPGWLNRLDGFKTGSVAKTNSPADFLQPDERVKLLDSATREYERQVRERMELAEKQAALVRVDSGLPLDPKNELDRKALNTRYGETVRQWQAEGVDPASILTRSVDYAVQKALVPDGLQAMIRSGLRTGNADLAVVAADTVRRIRNGNPNALDDFAEADLRRAEHIGSLTDAGFTPAEAARRADEAEKTPKNVLDARKNEYAESLKQEDAGEFLSDQLGSWFGDDPNDIPSPMVADFNQAAMMEYQRTGDMNAARNMAMNTVSRVWGTSRVGGQNRYMRYAPERYYGRPNLTPQQNADWMTKQLAADALEVAPDHLKPQAAAENITLVPATTGRQPGYYVNVLNADGYLEVLRGKNNLPLVWRPDYSTTEEALQENVTREESIRKARDLRQKKQLLNNLPDDAPGNPWGL